MTYPISIASAQSRSYADVVNPVDGYVQIVVQMNEELDAIKGHDPSQSPNLIWAMLPPGEAIGEDLTVIFQGPNSANYYGKNLMLGIAGPAAAPLGESGGGEQYHFVDRYNPNGSLKPWVSFDLTLPSLNTRAAVLFLKWVPEGWAVVSASFSPVFLNDPE